jgi:hypothetical protein
VRDVERKRQVAEGVGRRGGRGTRSHRGQARQFGRTREGDGNLRYSLENRRRHKWSCCSRWLFSKGSRGQCGPRL